MGCLFGVLGLGVVNLILALGVGLWVCNLG